MRLSLDHFFILYVTVFLAVLLGAWLFFLRDSPPFAIGRAANFHLWVLLEFFRRAGALPEAPLSRGVERSMDGKTVKESN